jgi:FGGY-family pentulose kinase
MATRNEGLLVGVDVGTAGVRAAVFASDGRLLASEATPIDVFHPQENYVEQSSREIWEATAQSVRAAVREAGVEPSSIAGIGFDATCSLVALDHDNRPITVSLTGDPDRNVIVWMDHRAEAQADLINGTSHPVLRYVGGKLSPEQQPPKLKWIKENLPETWANAGKFLDLADYLVFQACGDDVRSQCTVVCKWTYLGHEGEGGAWDMSFFKQIDLDDLFQGGRAGKRVGPLGSRAGFLTAAAASDLGLTEGTAVAVGIIDAHAGGIGVLGMHRAGDTDSGLNRLDGRLALIAGTSSCHMAVSPEARFIDGVWGPYFGAMIPGMWLNEGGQSAAGALIDHVIENHAAYGAVNRVASESGRTIYQVLNDDLSQIAPAELDEAMSKVHVLPYFHGNRSPRADSHARGMISGLTLDSSPRNLALLYLATVQALAHGTRHIVDEMNKAGYAIERIHACGGGSKNPLLMQEHADVTGCEIYLSPDAEPVLLGSAMLAAVASGIYPSVLTAIDSMSPEAEVVRPNRSRKPFLEAKHRVFLRMYEHQLEYRRMMESDIGV